MPLPVPRDGENESEFIARCNLLLMDEFPEREQRFAVCYEQWRQAKQQGARQFHYFQSMGSAFERDGRRFVLLRAVTTEPSGPTEPAGVKWRPSYASLRRCISSFGSAPLIGPPCRATRDELACGHAARRVMGRPVRFSVPDGFAEILYEVLDDQCWNAVRSGQWHDVSPQLTATSFHIEDDVTVLDDWTVDHVAFVDRGAFHDVEVVDWWQGDPQGVYRLAAQLYQDELKGLTLKQLEERIQISEDIAQAKELREKLEGLQRVREVRERLGLPERPYVEPPPLPENPMTASGLEARVRRRLKLFRRRRS